MQVKQKFIVVCEKRTGSHLLKGLINSHCNFVCDSERLNFNKKNGKQTDSKTRNLILDANFQTLLDEKFGEKYSDRKINIGFILHGDCIDEKIVRLIRDTSDLKFILLRRKSLLDRLFSHRVAKERGIYNSSAAPNLVDLPMVDIKLKHFISDSKDIISRYALLKELLAVTGPTFEVCYEELVHDQQGVMDRLFSFFNEPTVEVSTSLARQNPRRPSEGIVNYDTLVEQIARTPYKDYM